MFSCSRRSQRRSSFPDLGIEGAERLVEQQHFRLDGERPGQRDALPLAAGQLRRTTVGHEIELDELEQVADAPVDLGAGRPPVAGPDPQAERDVLEHRHVTEERVMLEHEADAPIAHVAIRGVLVFEQHRARVGGLQPRNHAQQRRLA